MLIHASGLSSQTVEIFGNMSSFPLEFDGYESKTFSYKATSDGSISVDVVYPEETDGAPSTVLIHYHGGFLVSRLLFTHDMLVTYWNRSSATDTVSCHTGWCTHLSLANGSL